MPCRLLSCAAAVVLLAAPALAVPSRFTGKKDPLTGSRTFELWDGSTAAVGPDGLAYRMRQGTRGGSVFSAFMAPNLDDLSLVRALSLPRREIATDRVVPGTRAEYRLVVPKDPTISNIYTALLAAAAQQPSPDVITASLGFGFDAVGYPGRYLEDDPIGQSVIASIVQKGIVVCISSNDGTRLYTPTAIGPDGGSAATDRLRPGETPTSTADDFASTIATRVADSGAIAVGGTTLDDIFSVPPQAGGALSRVGQFPETRFNGAASFSSGFGTRIDIAAPSDGIVALAHVCTQDPCTPQDAIPVLAGGTSASAPMVAAAAAVVIQAARLMGRSLTPWQVREILVHTGRPLSQAPQTDRTLSMGTQLDVTSALESVLGTDGTPSIARVSVAHRRELGDLGASFREDADPSAIDLAGPTDFSGNPTGQWLAGPITIAADVVNAQAGLQYALVVGHTRIAQATRAFRLLPSELLAAAGLPAVSAGAARRRRALRGAPPEHRGRVRRDAARVRSVRRPDHGAARARCASRGDGG